MILFFFFQAEDGIRDLYVTGVQTCALPISSARSTRTLSDGEPAGRARSWCHRPRERSEERRVGKECRSRWSPDQEKKKEKYIAMFPAHVRTSQDVGWD